MPLPLIGYSPAALRAEYQRGIEEGRLHCQRALFDALLQLLPRVASRIAQRPQQSIFTMVQDLVEVFSAEIAQRQQTLTYLETENQQLRARVSELESNLAEARPAKLVEQINALTAERNRYLQQACDLLVDSERTESESTTKIEKLQKEVERLDELIVKYEHRSRPQNAKH